MTVAAFSAKFRNKDETYSFCTIDCKIYCPPRHTVTVYFLKDMLNG